MLIEIDFKENIRLGRSAREESVVFFDRPQRTLFAAVCHYRENVRSELLSFYANFVSEDLSHDGQFVVQALSKLFSSDWFVARKFSVVRLWSDQGPHFRTYQYLASVSHFQDTLNTKFYIEFFAENHGKSCADSWFSVVAQALDHSKRAGTYMRNTAELLALLEGAFAEMQQNGSKWQQQTFVFTCDRAAPMLYHRVAKNDAFISSYYRHQFANGYVLSQVGEEAAQRRKLNIKQTMQKRATRLGTSITDKPTHERPHLEGEYQKQKRRRKAQGSVGTSDTERCDAASSLLVLTSNSSASN